MPLLGRPLGPQKSLPSPWEGWPAQAVLAQPVPPLSVLSCSLIHHLDQTNIDKGQSDAFDPAKRQPCLLGIPGEGSVPGPT